MPIKVKCPSCETVNTAVDEKAGKRIRCKECKDPIEVPIPGVKKKSAKAKPEAAPKKKGSSGLLLALGGGVFLILILCVGGAIAGFFLYPWKATDPAKPASKDKVVVAPPAKKAEPKPPVEIFTLLPGFTTRFGVSGDGKLAIVATNGGTPDKKSVQIWNLDTKKKMSEFPSDGVTGVAMSPDGKHAAFTHINGTVVKLIDVAAGNEVQEYRKQGDPARFFEMRLRFSPKGDLLLRAGERGILGWNVPGKERYSSQVSGGVESLSSFFDDGKKFVTGGSKGSVQVWEVGSPQAIKTFSHKTNNPISRVAVSADGKKIASNEWNNKLFIWDVAAGTNTVQTLRDVPSLKSPCVLTSDGKMFIYSTMKNKLVMVNTETGAVEYELKRMNDGNSEIAGLELTADGATLISLNQDNVIRLWEIKELK